MKMWQSLVEKRIVKTALMVIMLSLTASSMQASESQPLATLSMSVGDVLVQRYQKSKWIVASIGTFIFEGDKLQTKSSGKAEVQFNNGSVVFVGPETEMEFVQKLDEKTKKQTQSLFLYFGSMWNKVVTGTEYEVETAHALATVKGTEFNVSVGDSTDVWVREGAVDIVNEYGSVRAKKGTRTRVSGDSAPQKTKVRKNEFPGDVSFEDALDVDLSVPTQLYQAQWYHVKGAVKNKSDKPNATTVPLNIRSSDGVLISGDKQQKAKQLDMEVADGSFEFYIYSKVESGNITITSAETLSLTQPLKFRSEQKEKSILLEYKDQDGKKRTLEAVFKKQ